MRCSSCRSEKVVALPANEFSRRPGYEYQQCGQQMRPPGVLFYGFVIVLGLAMAVLGVVVLVAFRPNPRAGGAVLLSLAGLACAWWAVDRLRLPAPLPDERGR